MATISNQDHTIIKANLQMVGGLDEPTKAIIRHHWVRNTLHSCIIVSENGTLKDVHLISMARQTEVDGKPHLIIVVSSCSNTISSPITITPTFISVDCGEIVESDYIDDTLCVD